MTKKIMILLAAIVLLTGMLPALTLAQEPLACEDVYTVQAGDWLSKIAEKYYGDILAYDLIVKANNLQGDDPYTDIANPDIIEPGWTLCIPDVSEQTSSTADLTGVVWQWQTTLMNNDDQFTPDNPANYTLQFNADGTFTAQADCNQVSGSYTLENSQLSIVPGPSTMAACPEGSLGDQFVKNLGEANRFLFEGDDLIISLMFDSGSMRFSPQSNDLAGTSWIVVSHNNGQGGVVSSIIGTEMTADFGADGTLVGSSGCKTYSGEYKVEGEAITISLLPVSIMIACEEPEGIMAQEEEYLAALGTVATYQINGDRLNMRTAEGATAVDFVAAK